MNVRLSDSALAQRVQRKVSPMKGRPFLSEQRALPLPLALALAGLLLCFPRSGHVFGQEIVSGTDPLAFPVEASVLVDGIFQRCEGIAFNGEGDLFVAGNSALWRVAPNGAVDLVAELYSNLGLAPLGARDILMADFGPTTRFDRGPNADGIVWRITPEGEKTRVVDGGVGDPNALWVRPDGTFLVSDDATDEILLADLQGNVRLFTDAVGHPNGLAVSADGSTLFVAQIFKSLRPLVPDGRVWAIPLTDGDISGLPEVIADLGPEAANDGLALDEGGRLYVAANGAGQVWRVDPGTGETVLIAEGLPGVASLAFGRGDFDPNSLYATSTRTGKVWRVEVGVPGGKLHGYSLLLESPTTPRSQR